MNKKSIIMLCGCGIIIVLLIIIFNLGLKPVQENKIKTDLMESDEVINCFYSDFVSESEYELIRYDTTKRQTNKDEKEDIVYCQIEIENEYFNIVLDLVLYYTYYDEGGWILDNLRVDNQECKAISSPNMDLVFEYVKSKQPAGKFIVENDYWNGVADYGELSYLDSSFNSSNNTSTLTVNYESPVISIWGDYILDFYAEAGQNSGWVIRCFEDGWYEGSPCIQNNYSYTMKYEDVALGNYSGLIIKKIDNQGILFDSPKNNLYDILLDFNPLTGGFVLNRNDFDLEAIVLENGTEIWFSSYTYNPDVDEWHPITGSKKELNLVREA